MIAAALHDVTAVTFDAAGTLLRPHPSVGSVYREVALRHGCDYAAEVLERAFHAAFAKVSKDDIALDPEARERVFWRRIVLETVHAVGPPPADFDALFAALWETFAHGERWRLFPGASETLTTLRARGYRLAVVSNWDRRLHTVLHEIGLRPVLEAVIISSEAGAEKPDAGIFRAAEIALHAKPHECLHVGDSRKHDVAGALAAGWHALLIRQDDAPGAQGEIARLNDLLALLPGRPAR